LYRASILTAIKAPFFAPAFPIAMTATGTLPGICAVDKRASRPFSDVASMGTPITGRVVCEAMTPAR